MQYAEIKGEAFTELTANQIFAYNSLLDGWTHFQHWNHDNLVALAHYVYQPKGKIQQESFVNNFEYSNENTVVWDFLQANPSNPGFSAEPYQLFQPLGPEDTPITHTSSCRDLFIDVRAAYAANPSSDQANWEKLYQMFDALIKSNERILSLIFCDPQDWILMAIFYYGQDAVMNSEGWQQAFVDIYKHLPPNNDPAFECIMYWFFRFANMSGFFTKLPALYQQLLESYAGYTPVNCPSEY